MTAACGVKAALGQKVRRRARVAVRQARGYGTLFRRTRGARLTASNVKYRSARLEHLAIDKEYLEVLSSNTLQQQGSCT